MAFLIWQNNSISVTYYEYVTTEYIGETDTRLVLISDLHNKKFGSRQGRLLEEIEKCNPDIIVVTGDLVDSTHTDIDMAMTFIEGALKIVPIYYVTGNHENWLQDDVREDLMNRLAACGVTILDDRQEELKINGNTILLTGLDDSSLKGSVLHNLTEDDADRLVVLLAHEPQNLERYSRENVDLVLAGHAHGGQIRIPFAGGLIAPDQGFFPKYTAGVYEEKSTTMIVSRGLGNSVIPLRIFNRPEIVCIDITSGF